MISGLGFFIVEAGCRAGCTTQNLRRSYFVSIYFYYLFIIFVLFVLLILLLIMTMNTMQRITLQVMVGMMSQWQDIMCGSYLWTDEITMSPKKIFFRNFSTLAQRQNPEILAQNPEILALRQNRFWRWRPSWG